MHPAFVARGTAARPIPIWFVTPATGAAFRDGLEKGARAFVDAAGFEPKPGRHLMLPATEGGVSGVLFAVEAEPGNDPFLPGRLPGMLPSGTYRFANAAQRAR